MKGKDIHDALEKDYHTKRMDAAAFRVLFPTTVDILEISDDPVFSETNPPYNQEEDKE